MIIGCAIKLKSGPLTGQRTPPAAAFSLVEVMVAVCVLGILIIALLSGITFGFTNMRLSRENARASQILLEKLEQFRLLNWQQITTNGLPTSFVSAYYPFATNSSAGFNYTGTVTIATAPYTESYASNLCLEITLRQQIE